MSRVRQCHDLLPSLHVAAATAAAPAAAATAAAATSPGEVNSMVYILSARGASDLAANDATLGLLRVRTDVPRRTTRNPAMSTLPGNDDRREGWRDDGWRGDAPIIVWSRLARGGGLSRAQWAMLAHVASRGVLTSESRTTGYWTKTHPVYARLILAQLVRRGMLKMTRHPGYPNKYWLAPMADFYRIIPKAEADRMERDLAQLLGRAEGAIATESQAELLLSIRGEWLHRTMEPLSEADGKALEKWVKESPEKFERVLAETCDRQRRGTLTGADSLKPLESAIAYFKYQWAKMK